MDYGVVQGTERRQGAAPSRSDKVESDDRVNDPLLPPAPPPPEPLNPGPDFVEALHEKCAEAERAVGQAVLSNYRSCHGSLFQSHTPILHASSICPLCAVRPDTARSEPSVSVEPTPTGPRRLSDADLRTRAERWIDAHPHAFGALERLALGFAREGRRVGIGYLAERVRHELRVTKSPDEAFALNNSYRSYIARILAERHEELRDTFRFRNVRG